MYLIKTNFTFQNSINLSNSIHQMFFNKNY